MTLTKCNLAPEKQSYTHQDGNEIVSVNLDGGLSRTRRDKINSAMIVGVQWSCDKFTYNYMRSFYRGVTESGALPFLIDLLVDDACALTEVEAKFVTGTFRLASHSGANYIITANLEIKPPVGSGDIAYWLNEFNMDPYNAMFYEDELNTVVNSNLPVDLPA